MKKNLLFCRASDRVPFLTANAHAAGNAEYVAPLYDE